MFRGQRDILLRRAQTACMKVWRALHDQGPIETLLFQMIQNIQFRNVLTCERGVTKDEGADKKSSYGFFHGLSFDSTWCVSDKNELFLKFHEIFQLIIYLDLSNANRKIDEDVFIWLKGLLREVSSYHDLVKSKYKPSVLL